MDSDGSPPLRDDFEVLGRVWFRDALSRETLEDLDAIASSVGGASGRIEMSPELFRVIGPGSELAGLMGLFVSDLVPVRVVLFDKTQNENWAVPWHQGRVIQVAERHDLPGFKNWSRKAGKWHCEPPEEILEQLFFVRIHLDDMGEEAGAMRIACGSHRAGIVPTRLAEEVVSNFPLESCAALRGDVLVLKMLTLHCSEPSEYAGQRRVLRVDFAPKHILPEPMAWPVATK